MWWSDEKEGVCPEGLGDKGKQGHSYSVDKGGPGDTKVVRKRLIWGAGAPSCGNDEVLAPTPDESYVWVCGPTAAAVCIIESHADVHDLGCCLKSCGFSSSLLSWYRPSPIAVQQSRHNWVWVTWTYPMPGRLLSSHCTDVTTVARGRLALALGRLRKGEA